MSESVPHPALRSGLRAVTGLSRALGPARYGIADAVGLGVYAFQPGRRRRAFANHRRCDPAIDVREARRRARRSFREYARTTADFLWANAMDDAAIRRVSRVRGLERITAARQAGRGAVLALGHFGNWDMAANIAVAYGVEVTTVMAPLGPPRISDLVRWARQRNRVEVYPPENAARGLLRGLRAGRFVALLCDIPEAGPTVTVDFCGGPVRFSAVPAWLTLRTGAPLIPVHCRRGAGGYEAEAHAPMEVMPGDDEAMLMQRVAAELEQAIRLHPTQWYPFGKLYVDSG